MNSEKLVVAVKKLGKVLRLLVGGKCVQVSIFYIVCNYLTIDNFKYVCFEHVIYIFGFLISKQY